ncbi:MAG: GNAT family N-acetyltransferase [Wenzhouxiangellaceae bacterium]|nr:GNAT family N-acetyltransferase [Wenzhouxiangellaceae bacterium]
MTHTIAQWRIQRFGELSTADLYALLAVRVAVFVVEQDCPYQDLDGLDDIALHVSGWSGDGRPLAYARILPPHSRFEQPSIGRVLTAAPARGLRFGVGLMRRSIDATREVYPGRDIRISAQCYLERFYRSLGFQSASAPYEEDGIPHLEMLLPADADAVDTDPG